MEEKHAREYKLLADIEWAFDNLIKRIQEACEIYQQEAVEAWSLHHPTPDSDWLYHVLLDFWFDGQQDGRRTTPYIGMIAAPPRLWDAFVVVNSAKDQFYELLQEIRDLDNAIYAPLKGWLLHRHPKVGAGLAGVGLARINLKQAWRRIPIVEAPVKRVNFSWYVSGRSIRRITVRDAEKQLSKLNSDEPHIKVQMSLLSGLPSSEPLAQVQLLSPAMRANVYFDPEASVPPEDESRSMNIALPLVVPSVTGQLPHFVEPPPSPPEGRTNAKRKDQKIEDEPFLRSIRVHRYKETSEDVITHEK